MIFQDFSTVLERFRSVYNLLIFPVMQKEGMGVPPNCAKEKSAENVVNYENVDNVGNPVLESPPDPGSRFSMLLGAPSENAHSATSFTW